MNLLPGLSSVQEVLSTHDKPQKHLSPDFENPLSIPNPDLLQELLLQWLVRSSIVVIAVEHFEALQWLASMVDIPSRLKSDSQTVSSKNCWVFNLPFNEIYRLIWFSKPIFFVFKNGSQKYQKKKITQIHPSATRGIFGHLTAELDPWW